MTGLPFVWAFWAGRADALDGTSVVSTLAEAAARGGRALDAIASSYCADHPERIPVARQYLAENLEFHFSARALEGLETYYREARLAGLVSSVRPPEFYDAPAERGL
jgi:predicted solute-binding protein